MERAGEGGLTDEERKINTFFGGGIREKLKYTFQSFMRSLDCILDFNFKGAHRHTHTQGHTNITTEGQKVKRHLFQANEASWRKSADCSKSQNDQKEPRVEWRHFQRLPLSLSLFSSPTHTNTHTRLWTLALPHDSLPKLCVYSQTRNVNTGPNEWRRILAVRILFIFLLFFFINSSSDE